MFIRIELTDEEFARLAAWLVSDGNRLNKYLSVKNPEIEAGANHSPIVILQKAENSGSQENRRQTAYLDFPDHITMTAWYQSSCRMELRRQGGSEYGLIGTWEKIPDKPPSHLKIIHEVGMTYLVVMTDPSPIMGDMFAAIRKNG